MGARLTRDRPKGPLTPEELATGVPTPDGGLIVTLSNGGKVKRGGRHSRPGHHGGKKRIELNHAVRGMLEDALTSQKCRDACRKILANPDHRHFVALMTLATNRLFGMPRQSVAISGQVGATIEFQPLTVLLPKLEAKAHVVALPSPEQLAEAQQSWAPEISVEPEDDLFG